MNRLHKVFLSLAIILYMASVPLWAQDSGEETVTLNLKNSDINAVITTVAKVTGRNFLVDPRVKGKVSIISAHPMKKDELYDVFLSILEVHGFAAIDDGKVVKIIPNALAKQRPIPTTSDSSAYPGDDVVTQIIPIENVQAQQLTALLKPLMPQEGHIAHYDASNILIVSDRAGNINRINKIIQRIDQVSEDEIEVIPLQNASASEVVRIITALDQQQAKDKAPVQRATIIADDRTNSVLISGDKGSKIRIRTIVAHLDTPLDTAGNTQVIYLKYAQAKDLVAVLTDVAENKANEQGAKPAATKKSYSIQAHEPTNSLVITANPEQMRSLKSVIAQLDFRRAQVLVEAVIAEISENMTNQLGIQFNLSQKTTGKGVVGGTLLGGYQSAIGDIPTQNSGLSLGFFDGTENILGTSVLNMRVLITALSGDNNSNIIATPSLITLDNKEAEIVVARNVPFVTGRYDNSSSTTANPFQTIERQDVGMILKIKPQINEGNAVKLEIEQEVSNVEETTTTSAVDITTNKRNIKTTVIADDGQMIVLGGLMDDQVRQTQQKVPVLGDIPLLGNLFKNNGTTKEKRNLMIFLRPVILRDSEEASRIAHGRYDFIRARQIDRRKQGIKLMPDYNMPVLRDRNDVLKQSSVSINESDDLRSDEDDEPEDSTAVNDSGF